MTALDAGRGGELVNICGASGGAVEALLNTVACGLNLGECQVDLGDNTGDIEAADILGDC